MKLTKKFWRWLAEVAAWIIFMLRFDLVIAFLKLLPGIDLSQFRLELGAYWVAVVVWFLWLVWRAIDGFSRSMSFVIDPDRQRW